MRATAWAPGAISLVNAMFCGQGSAVAIDRGIEATVELTDDGSIVGEVADRPAVDTALIERAAELAIDRHGDGQGVRVRTTSTLPPSVGLKTSSAAANATVVATLEALDRWETVDRCSAARLGVEAARDVGVTQTGAFDDAAASMLGGAVVTDNRSDDLLERPSVAGTAVVVIPCGRRPTADIDPTTFGRFDAAGRAAIALVQSGEIGPGMTLNGLAVETALGGDGAILADGYPFAEGVSVSGTGPAVAAIAEGEAIDQLANAWSDHGRTFTCALPARGTRVDST